MISAYRSFIRWIGAKSWLPPLVAPILHRLDRMLLRRGAQATPFPTLLLTTTGVRSGQAHDAPLWYLEDDGYVVIATNYGRHEPDWSHNLRARPDCRLAVDNTSVAARAEPIAGEDFDRLLQRFVEFYPPYQAYVHRAERNIPMWRLVPG